MSIRNSKTANNSLKAFWPNIDYWYCCTNLHSPNYWRFCGFGMLIGRWCKWRRI